MDSFFKIFLCMQFISLVLCSPLPLSIESSTLLSSSLSSDLESSTSFEYPSTTPSLSTEPTIPPIVFSHDSNPFDPTSISFGENSNRNITKPTPTANGTNTPFNGSPIASWANVIPLPKLVSGHRQQRVQVFRPLFVYRQEQAMKRRESIKMNPDRFYPQYHYHYPPYPLPPYGADLYSSQFPEFVPNDISIASPAQPFGWYESNAHYAWPPQHALGYLQ